MVYVLHQGQLRHVRDTDDTPPGSKFFPDFPSGMRYLLQQWQLGETGGEEPPEDPDERELWFDDWDSDAYERWWAYQSVIDALPEP